MRAGIAMCLFFASLFCLLTLTAHADDSATPGEVIQKVREAADFLSKAGDAGLTAFADKAGKWVWKDTYVWCAQLRQADRMRHIPSTRNSWGPPLAGMKDAKGNYFFVQLCDKCKEPKGAWVEYWWPKVGEKQPSRKISYVLSVPDSPYQVAAGIYDEQIPLEELYQLLK